jgi:hypothetical protein
VAPIAILAGVIGLVTHWKRQAIRVGYLFLLVPAGLQVIALGIISYGEPRFIFFPLALVVICGAMTIEEWFRSDRSPGRSAVAWGLMVLVFGSMAFSVAHARNAVSLRSATFEPIELASDAIGIAAAGAPCSVMSAYPPQVTFYSGCATYYFRPNLDAEDALDRLSGDSRFMILVEPGKRQVDGQARDELLALTVGPHWIFTGDRNVVAVYEFDD